MIFPKPKKYYEFIYQSYRKKDRNSCHQYRLNGKVVNNEIYYDSRSDLMEKGARVIDVFTEDIGKNTERTTLLILLKKEE